MNGDAHSGLVVQFRETLHGHLGGDRQDVAPLLKFVKHWLEQAGLFGRFTLSFGVHISPDGQPATTVSVRPRATDPSTGTIQFWLSLPGGWKNEVNLTLKPDGANINGKPLTMLELEKALKESADQACRSWTEKAEMPKVLTTDEMNRIGDLINIRLAQAPDDQYGFILLRELMDALAVSFPELDRALLEGEVRRRATQGGDGSQLDQPNSTPPRIRLRAGRPPIVSYQEALVLKAVRDLMSTGEMYNVGTIVDRCEISPSNVGPLLSKLAKRGWLHQNGHGGPHLLTDDAPPVVLGRRRARINELSDLEPVFLRQKKDDDRVIAPVVEEPERLPEDGEEGDRPMTFDQLGSVLERLADARRRVSDAHKLAAEAKAELGSLARSLEELTASEEQLRRQHEEVLAKMEETRNSIKETEEVLATAMMYPEYESDKRILDEFARVAGQIHP